MAASRSSGRSKSSRSCCRRSTSLSSTTPTGKPQEGGPLASLWITHPGGRRYESLVYDMPGSAERCGPDDYNGYLGFTVTPKAGDWTKNQEHFSQIICSGDEALYRWVVQLDGRARAVARTPRFYGARAARQTGRRQRPLRSPDAWRAVLTSSNTSTSSARACSPASSTSICRARCSSLPTRARGAATRRPRTNSKAW